jgi:hypothetical protein
MAEDRQQLCRPADRVSLESNSRLYPRLLGPAWASLHPTVQRVHTVPGEVRAHAQFEVRRPPGRLLGLLLDLAAVPAAVADTAVELAVVERATPHGPRERWRRVFGGRPLVTLQQEAPGGLLSERAGPLEFRFRLRVEYGAMLFEQQGCWFRLGTMQLRLPRWLALSVWCREGAMDRADQTSVYVKVTAPSGGLLFSYQGTVTWNVTQVML